MIVNELLSIKVLKQNLKSQAAVQEPRLFPPALREPALEIGQRCSVAEREVHLAVEALVERGDDDPKHVVEGGTARGRRARRAARARPAYGARTHDAGKAELSAQRDARTLPTPHPAATFPVANDVNPSAALRARTAQPCAVARCPSRSRLAATIEPSKA